MSHTSKRITALMLALTMISIFPATTALALETEPITAEMTAEQLDISTPETARGAETEENTTATDDTAEAEENAEPAEELFDVQTAAEPVETAISVRAMPGANTTNYTVYRDLDFEKADSLGYTWRNPYRSPDNTWLNQSENGRDGGHALTVTQNTSSQKYFDVGELQNTNNGVVVSGQDLVLEQDVYL